MGIKVISRLSEILEERGMKQQFLVKKTGITSSTMSFIVRGQIPHLENAYKIAKALDLNVMEIWVMEEDDNNAT